MRILFLTPRFPYPPLRGDQVRAYHQIRLLGQRHAVTLLAVADRKVPQAARAHMQGLCEHVYIEPLTWPRQLTGLSRLVAGDSRPAQTLLYAATGHETVQNLITHGHFDVIHAQLLRTVSLLPSGHHPPLVVDLVDALSVSYGRRVAIESPWRRPALAFEVRRLARYEERLLRSEARCLVVSEADRRLLGSAGGRASVNPNGVDLAAFPFMPDQGTSGRIVFVGNLGYSPNSDAALWFATEVLPGVRTRVPESELVIVGPRAPRRVLNLAARPGVVVAGIVPDVHDALIAARVAIAPLRAGAGIQNKVLEAMAAGVPVVGTSLAVGGIDVVPGTHCLVADDPAGFAEAVASLLTQAELRHRIASAARDLVVARYTWERSVADLETIYREVVHAGITPRAAARGGQMSNVAPAPIGARSRHDESRPARPPRIVLRRDGLDHARCFRYFPRHRVD